MILKFFNDHDKTWNILDEVTKLSYRKDYDNIEYAMQIIKDEREDYSDSYKIFYLSKLEKVAIFIREDGKKVPVELNPTTNLNGKDYSIIKIGHIGDEEEYHWWPDYISYSQSRAYNYNSDDYKPLWRIEFEERGKHKLMLTDHWFPVYVCNDVGDTIEKIK